MEAGRRNGELTFLDILGGKTYPGIQAPCTLPGGGGRFIQVHGYSHPLWD
jgi:hypothetical protein